MIAMTSLIHVDDYEFKLYLNENGKLHRDDGPALAVNDGLHYIQQWWKDGVLHRDGDLPAHIGTADAELIEAIYFTIMKGIVRKILPYISFDMTKTWFVDGECHRDYGPAVIIRRNDEMVYRWFRYGEYHREDGPAYYLIDKNGSFKHEEFFVNGKIITLEVIKWIEENSFPPWQEWDDEIKMLFMLRFV